MVVYLGADHGGFELKEEIKGWVGEWGYEAEDCGAYEYDPKDDYPDFAGAVARKLGSSAESFFGDVRQDVINIGDRGILVCRSGVGVCIVANKFPGVRCALGFDKVQVKKAREDDDVNVLALPADYLTSKQVKGIVKTFLATEFSGEERHVRRLKKINLISN